MLRSSHLIQVTVLAMLCLSVLMIHSATMVLSSDSDLSPTQPDTLTQTAHQTQQPQPNPNQGSLSVQRMLTSRHTLHGLGAMLVMIFCSYLDIRSIVLKPRLFKNPLFWTLIIALAMVVLTLLKIGTFEKNGSSRWLKFAGISVQPSEFVKWLLIPTVAWWAAKHWSVMKRFWTGLCPMLLLIGLSCILVAKEDLGTGILIGAVCGGMLLAAGARWWQLLLVSLPAVAGVYFLIISKAYRLERVLAFLSPWEDMGGSGYQLTQGLLGIAEGRIVGRGLGQGVQKFYTPEDTTDFIFAPICEEIGLFGAAIVILMLLILLWTGIGIGKRCDDVFGRLLALGIILMLTTQGLMNMMVVTGLMPTTGIALPFISGGGTGWLITGAMVGLLASLDNATYFKQIRENTP